MKNCLNKKKILYLHAGAEMYGADKILLETVEVLDKNKFYPIIILPEMGILYNEFLNRGYEVYICNYPILRRKYFNIRGIINYISDYFKYSRKLNDFVKKNKIDIIHVNTSAVLEGIYIKLKSNIKLVWHVHEILQNPKLIAKIINKLILYFSNQVIVVSNAVRDNISNHNSKVRLVYNGIQTNKVENLDNIKVAKAKYNIKDSSKVIGMIGRINALKGQKDFLQAIFPILESDSTVHAFLIGGVYKGEEWRQEEIEEMIKNSGFTDRIHMLEFQPNVDIYYQIFDIFVLPSVLPDSFPTVVLEAMSFGNCVVGYNHGGIIEMISSPKDFLASPQNTSELSKIIRKCLDNNAIRNNEGLMNKKRQEQFFSTTVFKKNINNIYEAVSFDDKN